MSLHELETSWAATTDDLNYLHWELLACDAIRGVFPTMQADVLIVLFDGDRPDFEEWASTLMPDTDRRLEARR
jgi:hypothetical protein